MVAIGSKDAPLTLNPEITFFKILYKKHTNFAIQQTIKNLGEKSFNTFNTYKLEKNGDLLLGMHYKINIPKFEIIKNNTNINNTNYYDINSLEIFYNRDDAYVFFYNNIFYVVPKYIVNLYNYDNNNIQVPIKTIIDNLIPELINSANVAKQAFILDINEDNHNSIISLLRKIGNFWENNLLTYLDNNDDYEYYNQSITLKLYVNHLSLQVDNALYENYNLYNNFNNNKEYYKLDEVKQYLLYVNNSDINFIVKNNYDVDVIYDYCIKNEVLNYLLYQKNSLLINSLFIYNILLQLYPSTFNNFTFWKKYILLSSNKPNLDFNVNTYNKFGEWSDNLNNLMPEIINSTNITLLYDIYKRNYSIAENNINQLFNLLVIKNPSQLFIILSTFINQYDSTLSTINFSDYNSLPSATNFLDQKINEQLDKYNELNIVNSEIFAVPNIAKNLTIYPIDLTVLYGFLAYRLIDSLANSLTFSNNLFLIYWRNKINNYCFMNYHQYNADNINNTDLYDSFDLNRKLTFYATFSMRNLLKLDDIKKYFIELFYSSSFFCCCDLDETEFTNLKSTLNIINIGQLQVNNEPISLNESAINSYNDVKIINSYIITNFIKDNYILKIVNWNNNSRVSSSYYIIINEIKYNAISFTNSNFELTLTFNYLPNIISTFILKEIHEIKVPLVSITNGVIPLNTFDNITIYNKINNIIVIDDIESDILFTLNNLIIKSSKTINDYIYYFKLVSININGTISRYLIDILNSDGNYIIQSNENKVFNKKEILSINLEFINVTYRDIATKDANTIINNRFIINNRNDWEYDATKTYWLYYNNKYITLRYENGSFVVNDKLEPVVYIVREIDNSSIPSFNNLQGINNTNNISDLMDFVFQTPMMYLAKTSNINDLNTRPYIYFYNLPYLLNDSEIYLNNKKITVILPLNSNQYFGKSLTTLFDKENLLKPITHFELVKYISSQFDSIYYQSEYINIVNTLEKAKDIIINLNNNIILDNTYYGKTTETIIENIVKINSLDIIHFNNEDFNLCNKLALDLYGNNSSLISNSVIQGLVVNIYNYPILSNLPNRKITSNLIDYLNNVPVEFNNQINYVNNNEDFTLLTNKNSYTEEYSSLSDIKTTIKNTAYDYGNVYKIEFLYPLDDINYNSLYYNNEKVDISNNVIYNFNKIINNEDEYETTYVNIDENDFDHNKFNYLGPVYLNNNNINFTNIIDLSNYTHIKLDDNNMYLLSEFINIKSFLSNVMFKNSYLHKFTQIPYNYNIFSLIDSKVVYYYKLTIDLNGLYIADYGNCLFINNKFYYFEVYDYFLNIIEILSIHPLNMLDKNYFIGFIIVNTINDILYPTYSTVLTITSIKLINIELTANNIFNYYNSDNTIYNNLLFKNKIISPIKKINIYNLIYLDSSSNNIKLTENLLELKKLPHIYLKNSEIISENINEDLFRKHSKNNLVKIDNYILNLNDLSNNYISSGNYELSILPLENPNLINFSVSGYITKGNNQIVINFNGTVQNIPLPAYYNINKSYIYLESVNNQIIINDKNMNYYNIGNFNNIILLDNNYFKKAYPLFLNYEYITLNENLEGKLSYVNQNIPSINEYVVDSMFNNNIYNDIYSYDLSNIKINIEDEQIIELLFYNTVNFTYLLRPIIIKYKNPLINYPTTNFSWNNNNQIYNNSFIILQQIPQPTVGFTTLTITFSETITSIESLQPCISIFSNTSFSMNTISFNDINGLTNNKLYKWKLLINKNFAVYFWTYFSSTNFIYTSNTVSEPVYLNDNNINLFSLTNNIQLSNASDVLTLDNNVIKLNLLYYYNDISRKLTKKYYNDSFITNNKSYNILPYNNLPYNKYSPSLMYLDNIEIKLFTNSFIYLDEASIKILLEAKYLLIHNNKFYYTNIVSYTNEGIFVNTSYFNLDTNYKLNIYYSYSNIIYSNNNIVISKINNEYKIVAYQYNNFSTSEIISVNNTYFQIVGLNSFTNYYDINLISNNELSINNLNGYYSLGIPNDKQIFNFPIVIYKEPITYTLDTYFLNLGDYYINNNVLTYKLNNTLEYDIFSYNKTGIIIKIFVKDNCFYNINELTRINQFDILVYNNVTYHIKTITNFQLYFNESVYLDDGFYDFYYPYQPFNNAYVTINNIGEIVYSSLKLEPYYFIEFDNIFYSLDIIPSKYYNTKYYVRVASFQDNRLYFENTLYLNKYVNNIKLDTTPVLYVKGTIVDAYTIDLNDNKIQSIYFYYNQPIKVGSSINFIKSLIYRDTTIILTLRYPLKLLVSSVDIYLSPLALHKTKYLSSYEIDNFRAPSIDISNNIVEYILDNKLLAINTKINNPINNPVNITKLFYVDNYLQIDSNKNKILSSLEIDSYHLLLEVTPENNLFVHLCKIVYPHNLYFYTDIINVTSKFLLDKIYNVKINFIDNSFIFIKTNIHIKNRLLSKIEPIVIWYKYSVVINGVPIYNNNKFELEILNGNIFLDKEVYLTENATVYYTIVIKNSKYYLISDTYLGNNISYFYLQNINYIKSANPVEQTFKPFLQNHDDTRLYKYINPENTKTELVSNKTIINLDTVGDKYKYKLYDLNGNQYMLSNSTTYNIGDPFLSIDDNYKYNSNTFIFTSNSIFNSNNTTQLYNTVTTTTEYFDHLKMFKSIPNIISKLKINNKVENYMIINTIKDWKSWTILSSIDLNPVPLLLMPGNIYINSNIIYQDTSSNIYFTNNELSELGNLLTFINTSTLEYEKILIQNSLLDNILYELTNWVNDSTFWLNVKDTINYYITNLNINASFNGSCLVFNDEDINSTIYFDRSDVNNIKRKYVLNNQYILIGQNKISRDMTKINDEVNLLVQSIASLSNYGIELNNLLYTLYNLGEQYKIILEDLQNIEDVPTNYLNSFKILINHIWNNYKLKSTELNKYFNEKLEIVYKIEPTTKKSLVYFTNTFDFVQSNNYDISNEVYIEEYTLIENYNMDQDIINNYKLDSNAIYSYYTSFSQNIIIPEVVYELKFYNLSYDSYLFNLDKYPIELNFYLENDLPTDINYSIVGLTNYNVISNYEGKLYTITNNYNLDFNLIDNIIYKNTVVTIYNYDISSYNIASLLDIEYNNFLEINKNVGVKNQINNYLYFYQNNFNYVQNKTYINYNNIYYPLSLDISGNYYFTSNIKLSETITIVVLLELINFVDNNKYIYKLVLDKNFVNYNDYINSSNNIIPINFKLNNTYIPEEVIFYSENEIIVNVKDKLSIKYLSHYANIGETPPSQLNSIIKESIYLYKTEELSNILLPESNIWITDSSSYSNGILANTNYLNLTDTIQFTLNESYDNITLNNKKMYITTAWTVNDYIYDPINNKIVFIYPPKLIFSNNSQYEYLLNTNIISNNDILINKNQMILLNQTYISGTFYFIQKYKSILPINKPLLNQKAQITLLDKSQVVNDVFLIPFDNYGNNIGSLMYKILLKSNITNDKLTQVDLIISNLTYRVNIFYWLSLNEIVITTNEILPSGNYKVDVGEIIIDVISLNYYQESYQEGTFYYQDNIENFYIFVNEECNNFNFSSYYVHAKKVVIDLNNIYNPRNFERLDSMKQTVISENTINNIIEQPKINPKKIFKYISFYIGDQLIETLDEYIYDIIYNCYSNDENKKQIEQLIKVRENKEGYEIYIPLLFWFYYKSTLSLPNVALPYVDVSLKYQINDLNEILSNDLYNAKLSIKPTIHIELVLDTILLDTPERLLFGSYSHEYIIERFVIYPKNIIYKDKQTINIKFSNLVKDMFWISKPIYHQEDTCYKKYIYDYDQKYKYYIDASKAYENYKVTNILTDTNIIYNGDFVLLKNIDTEIMLNSSSRITYINNDDLLNNYELRFVLFLMDKYCVNYSFENQIKNIRLYFIYIYKNKVNIFDISPIKTINIQSNSVDLVPTMDNTYYNTLIPYQKFYNSPPIGYYINTFSLNPLEKQPSGHLNFNYLENITLNIETSISENNNEPFNLVAVVKEYQILRIMSGQASLAWVK